MCLLILWQRNVRWRFRHAFSFAITLLQPLLWLCLYGAAAGPALQGTGIAQYRAFILPGLMVLVSFAACGSGGMMNYMTKGDGSFYRVLGGPAPLPCLVLAHLLEAVACAFFETAALCGAALALGVRFQTGVGRLLGAGLLLFQAAFFLAGLAYGLSLLLPGPAVYETVMNTLALPAFFLSSALFPADRLSGAVGLLARANPFTPLVGLLRALLLEGGAAYSRLWGISGLFLALDAVAFGWACLCLGREKWG